LKVDFWYIDNLRNNLDCFKMNIAFYNYYIDRKIYTNCCAVCKKPRVTLCNCGEAYCSNTCKIIDTEYHKYFCDIYLSTGYHCYYFCAEYYFKTYIKKYKISSALVVFIAEDLLQVVNGDVENMKMIHTFEEISKFMNDENINRSTKGIILHVSKHSINIYHHVAPYGNNCEICGLITNNLITCNSCNIARYCGDTCMSKDQEYHNKYCGRFAKVLEEKIKNIIYNEEENFMFKDMDSENPITNTIKFHNKLYSDITTDVRSAFNNSFVAVLVQRHNIWKIVEVKNNRLRWGICEYCGNSGIRLKCSMCRTAHYCGVDCQRHDWKRHRIFCNIMIVTGKSAYYYYTRRKIKDINKLILKYKNYKFAVIVYPERKVITNVIEIKQLGISLEKLKSFGKKIFVYFPELNIIILI
jgi:hypothetical protein